MGIYPATVPGKEGFYNMIKEKTFYKSFMVLAFSLALQNLLTYGVNMMDTVMLGRYSQDAMGGVSLVQPGAVPAANAGRWRR